jgi:hypothetical protein
MNAIPRILTTALALTCHALSAAEFHVAPIGNDANPGTKDKPFATLVRARDAIRTLKQGGPLPEPVTVQIRGGAYFLANTLVFGPEDSGTEQAPITPKAAVD